MVKDGRTMDDPSAFLDLSQLDTCHPTRLDPTIWSANLRALAGVAPSLGEQLRSVALPENWRSVRSLDGEVTFRIEPPGEVPQWFGRSAAPSTRARARLAAFDSGGKNPALSTSAAVAELRILLARLARQIAIYVFEEDVSALAAALRLIDLSGPLAEGRCIVIPPGHEESSLTELLAAETGLLPPGTILMPDLVTAERLEYLRALCERIHVKTDERRTARIGQLTCTDRTALPESPTPRVAVLALQPRPGARAVAAELIQAAQELGWETLCRTQAHPRDVYPLVHCEAVVGFQPSCTLCVNHMPSALPMRPAGAICAWIHSPAAIPPEVPADDTLYLAATPRTFSALKQAGVRQEQVLPWYWGCAAGEEGAREPAAGDDSADTDGTVLLVGDLPAGRAERHGIKQGTHQRLWQTARELVAQEWETSRELRAQQVLTRAERATGIELTDRTLRSSFTELIERAMIPAVVWERVATTLAQEDTALLSIGHDWQRLEETGVQPLGDTLHETPECGAALYPLACIFNAAQEVVGPTLIRAAAMRWPILVCNPGKQPLDSILGDLLQTDRHFAVVTDVAGLRGALESVREGAPAVRRRLERAHEHVRALHTYTRRWQDLLTHLQRSGER